MVGFFASRGGKHGEMNERNDGSWLELDESNADLTCNVELRFALTPDDEQLWNTMDSVPWAS
jgi:hypothetical protein